MQEIYATIMEFEQCPPDKEHYRLIVPHTVIHYVLSGSGTVNGQRITAGSAFVATKNSFMDYYPDESDPWSYIYIHLYGEERENAFRDAGLPEGTYVIPFDRPEELRSLLSLHRAFGGKENREGGQIIANALMLLHKERTEDTAIGAQERNARKVKQYLDEHYFRKITVSDVAERFFLSEKYLRNLFVKFYDISPKQYLQSKRMQRAKTLLLETDADISSVALSVGYDDPLLFSRMFARHFSLSPRKYRQQMLLINSEKVHNSG